MIHAVIIVIVINRSSVVFTPLFLNLIKIK